MSRQTHGAGCALEVRVANRAIEARISSAVFVHLNGLGSSLCASRYSGMAARSSLLLLCDPLRRACFGKQPEEALYEIEPRPLAA